MIVLIMDSYGLNEETKGNAIMAANTPNLDYYFANYPNTVLRASCRDVGLLDGQMGNSEVGHINIGTGG